MAHTVGTHQDVVSVAEPAALDRPSIVDDKIGGLNVSEFLQTVRADLLLPQVERLDEFTAIIGR